MKQYLTNTQRALFPVLNDLGISACYYDACDNMV